MMLRHDDLRQSLMADSKIPGLGILVMAVSTVVALALAVIAMLLWENWSIRTHALAEARLAVYHECKILSDSAARTVEIAELAIAYLAEDFLDHSSDANSLESLILSRLSRFPPLAALNVYDGKGRLVAALGSSRVVDDVSDSRFFQDHGTGSVESMVTAEEPQGRIRVSHRLVTSDGHFAGVIVAVISPTAFDESFAADSGGSRPPIPG